jgi:hypothetical protein
MYKTTFDPNKQFDSYALLGNILRDSLQPTSCQHEQRSTTTNRTATGICLRMNSRLAQEHRVNEVTRGL